jgi:hypothetical protein
MSSRLGGEPKCRKDTWQALSAMQERNHMHQIAARTAIRPVLVKFHPNLVGTVAGRAKIESMVWDIMESLDRGGLRFVSTKAN